VTHRYLLDTNIISEPLRPEPNTEVLRQLRENEDVIALAAPVWHELVHGAQLLEQSKKRRTIEHYLANVVRSSFPILPYDELAADWHASERARLTKAGLTPTFVDGQIAAITRTNDLILITANRRDFERFSDLAMEDWSATPTAPSATRLANV